MVADDIATGKLKAVLSQYAQTRGDMWLVWPAVRTQAPRLRVFLTFITQAIESASS